MKRVIITFILAVFIMCINSLYAQEFPTDKGSKLVFGSFAFSSAGGTYDGVWVSNG